MTSSNSEEGFGGILRSLISDVLGLRGLYKPEDAWHMDCENNRRVRERVGICKKRRMIEKTGNETISWSNYEHATRDFG